MSPAARYTPVGAVLVRAPALPVEAYLALPVTPAADDEPVAPRDPLVRAAVAVASPDLLDQLDRARGGSPAAARAAAALLRYRIRMSTRATPFGLFAGVGLAQLGERTELRLCNRPLRTRMRPDMAWLLALVAQLEARAEVRRELAVMTNPSAWVHGGRVLLAQRAAVDASGAAGPVDIRATGVVRRALDLARHPIAWRDLAAELAAAPGASADKVEGLLTELWLQTFLITQLRPPLTHPSPARYVESCLPGIDAAREEKATLAALLAEMEAWDASDLRDRPAAQRALGARAAHAVPALQGTPWQVDAALALEGALGRPVADAAARAVELLLRLGPASSIGGLDGYRRAFASRYGAAREVALLELLDPERGLGPPASFGGTEDPAEAAVTTRRDARLRQIAVDALRERRLAVVLDEEAFSQLAAEGPPPQRAPLSVDLSVFVLANSVGELDRGDVRLVIGPNLGAQAAGRNLGRFADLLGAPATHALTALAAAVRERQPGRLHAELVYLPRRPRSANVAIRPRIHEHEVVVTTMPGVQPRRAIALSELLVGLRGTRFYVRWPGAPGDLVVHAGHMLNPRGAPAACRFLEEVARDERAPLSGLGWGPAGELPFLPRVEVGCVVLSPARWRIDALVRDERLAPEHERFHERLTSWREDWMVPRRVYLAVGDNRLLLDLESPAQVGELREELRRVRDADVILQEPLPGPEHAWLEGPGGHYLPELIVSLVQREPLETATPDAAGALATGGVARADRLRAPGSDWLFAKLYGPASGQDEILAGPVRSFAEFATASGLAERWFFVRYADPEPHLRLRFAGDPDDLVDGLLPHLCRWAQELLADGICDRVGLDTYEREIERYGGVAGMAAAERIFAIDSATAVELLDVVRGGAIGLDATALAVLSVDTLLADLGLDEPRRLALYRRAVLARHETGGEYRHRQRELRSLLAHHDAGGDDPGGVIGRLLAARGSALMGPAQRLVALAAGRQLAVPLDDICQSLVHMHCNRLLGRPGPTEQQVLGLALRVREGLERAPLPRRD